MRYAVSRHSCPAVVVQGYWVLDTCFLFVCTPWQTPLRVDERESAHVRDVTCVSFGRRRSDVVATGSLDGTLRVWDLSE